MNKLSLIILIAAMAAGMVGFTDFTNVSVIGEMKDSTIYFARVACVVLVVVSLITTQLSKSKIN